jgi:putative acetyltransferase
VNSDSKHNVQIRLATPEDADAIAEAHMHSIRTLGPQGYPPEVVADWGKHRDGSRYLEAMKSGEVFFLAISPDKKCLGFSSLRKMDGNWRIAVYVQGNAARKGVGRKLINAAEILAQERKAEFIILDASLVAVPFYKACGYQELGPGPHRILSGLEMQCVKMRKDFKYSNEPG